MSVSQTEGVASIQPLPLHKLHKPIRSDQRDGTVRPDRYMPLGNLTDYKVHVLSTAHPCMVLHRESNSTCASEVTCKVASRLPEP